MRKTESTTTCTHDLTLAILLGILRRITWNIRFALLETADMMIAIYP